MKLLLEQWRGYLKEEGSPHIMYHTTLQPQNAESIETNGLIGGEHENIGFSMSSNWVNSVYGVRPVYLSINPNDGGSRRYEGIVFEVDVSGIDLLPDLPTLVDYGAYVEEGEGLYWEDGTAPRELRNFLDDGMLWFDDILMLGSPAAQAIINFTKTAVSLESIPPERIKRIK
jgi:hypothetical protein